MKVELGAQRHEYRSTVAPIHYDPEGNAEAYCGTMRGDSPVFSVTGEFGLVTCEHCFKSWAVQRALLQQSRRTHPNPGTGAACPECE